MSRKPLSVQAQQDRLRRKRREAGEVLTIFRKPLKESLTSVLPITAIVLVLCFTITPISNNAMMAFLLGSLLLIVGMGLFTLGSEMSMIPLGEAVGKEITRSKKVWVIVAISFLDRRHHHRGGAGSAGAGRAGAVYPGSGHHLVRGAGRGGFSGDRLLRILFAIQLSYLLICFYAIVFVLAGFVSPDFWGRRLRLRRRHHRPHDGTLYHGAGRGRQRRAVTTGRRGATASVWWPCVPSAPSSRYCCWACCTARRQHLYPGERAGCQGHGGDVPVVYPCAAGVFQGDLPFSGAHLAFSSCSSWSPGGCTGGRS